MPWAFEKLRLTFLCRWTIHKLAQVSSKIPYFADSLFLQRKMQKSYNYTMSVFSEDENYMSKASEKDVF